MFHGSCNGRERKLDRHEKQCKDNGWQCEVFAVEDGCKGFIGKSVITFLQQTGVYGQRLCKATDSLAITEDISLEWIWNQHCIISKANQSLSVLSRLSKLTLFHQVMELI